MSKLVFSDTEQFAPGSLPVNSERENVASRQAECPYKFTPYNLDGPHTKASFQRPQNIAVLRRKGYEPQNENIQEPKTSFSCPPGYALPQN